MGAKEEGFSQFWAVCGLGARRLALSDHALGFELPFDPSSQTLSQPRLVLLPLSRARIADARPRLAYCDMAPKRKPKLEEEDDEDAAPETAPPTKSPRKSPKKKWTRQKWQ